MCGQNENTKSPCRFLSSTDLSKREITANNVRGLLSYRDTLVALTLCVARCSNWVFHFSSCPCGYLCDWYIYGYVNQHIHIRCRRDEKRGRERERDRDRERERERERDFGESLHKVRICPTRHQQGGIEKLPGNPDSLSRSNPNLLVSASFFMSSSLLLISPPFI